MTTTREITFILASPTGAVTETRQMPAGTPVYVGKVRNGQATIRVCGTLFEQRVYVTSSINNR